MLRVGEKLKMAFSAWKYNSNFESIFFNLEIEANG